MMTKEVETGHELLGRAADENKPIYLENIPENYVELSPGMSSEARPRNLLISPMSINDDIYGLFEIISYHTFEPHQIEFVQKLS
jgi:hypothetical protein